MVHCRSRMRLTPELVALCHREIAPREPDPRYDYFSDEDYARETAGLLAAKPEGPLWIFAYGSLIWKPEIDIVERRRAVAPAWHRTFALRIEDYRGTPEQPGYMLCLGRGGHCEGAVFRLGDADAEEQIGRLLLREIGSHEAMESVRWIGVETPQGALTALAFYAHPDRLDYYEEEAPNERIAHALARACGHWGSGAEYLYNTVSNLEELGIHDEGLWELQERVAVEIEALYGLSPADTRA